MARKRRAKETPTRLNGIGVAIVLSEPVCIAIAAIAAWLYLT